MQNFLELAQDKLNKLPDNAFQLIGDEWMLVTAQSDETVNTMTASWGGLGIMWGKKVAFVVIRPQRYTKEFIDASTTFSLSFFDKKYKKELAYCGAVSGRDEDKIAKTGFTIAHSESTPYFEEAKLVFICKKLFAQRFEKSAFLDEGILDKWYPSMDLHTLYIVEIEKALIKKSK